ncbi:MAG TPA: squalene synthase HpnC [Micropepsaceae bacterium]|jgi:squalene synthase HpnC|nr:squalene synthase HpnC [Micropepsaceae bacterium]
MRSAAELSSGKGHHDENFPVASFLIAPRHRPVILAFYRFARVADDVSDNAAASADEKLALLDVMRRTLLGETDVSPEAVSLRTMLAAHNLTPQHGLDLLEAFSRDVTKLRYRDWNDLIDYCRVSAMPVGRFVLDVHGEPRTLWPACDALCSALQIINHLQDCANDYRDLDRVYIPMDALAAAGTGPESLESQRASPALLNVIGGLAQRTSELLVQSRPFAAGIRDARLALEVSVIQTLAEDLCRRLMTRDPLSQRVHHRKSELLLLAFPALAGFAAGRLHRRAHPIVVADERR